MKTDSNQLSILSNQDKAQEDIKQFFETGGVLTVQKAFWKFHTTELRKVVCRLKDKGLNIVSKRVDGESYKEYWLDRSNKIKAA
jgi:hypothetical protein